MLAIQKGRSKPVRISCNRSEKLKVAPVVCVERALLPASLRPQTLPDQFLPPSESTWPIQLHAKALPNFLRCHARYSNDFLPAALPGCNGNGRAWDLQKFREEFDAGFVGF